jgi:hypothetical protein
LRGTWYLHPAHRADLNLDPPGSFHSLSLSSRALSDPINLSTNTLKNKRAVCHARHPPSTPQHPSTTTPASNARRLSVPIDGSSLWSRPSFAQKERVVSRHSTLDNPLRLRTRRIFDSTRYIDPKTRHINHDVCVISASLVSFPSLLCAAPNYQSRRQDLCIVVSIQDALLLTCR